MTTDIDGKRTGRTAIRAMRIGKAAVVVGLLVIAIPAFFVPDHQAKERARIAGGALVLVGGLGTVSDGSFRVRADPDAPMRPRRTAGPAFGPNPRRERR